MKAVIDDTVILAGGMASADLQALTGVKFRAEVPWGTGTMLDPVVNALAAVSPPEGPLIIGGPPREGRWVPGGDTLAQTLRLALEHVQGDRFLVSTCDLPFLTPESIAYLVEHLDPACDITYPMVPMELCRARFPGVPRTRLRLREGEFTGGNVFAFRTESLRTALAHFEAVYAARKSPVRLGAIVGWGTALRIVAAKLTPGLVSARRLAADVTARFGIPVQALVVPYAEIGTDVDDAAQYRSLLGLQQS